MDIWLALVMTALAMLGWVVGAFRRRSQIWIRIGLAPAVLWLAFYFALLLWATEAELYTGETEVGWPTLICMMGGVCALVANPRGGGGKHQDNAHEDNGAAAC